MASVCGLILHITRPIGADMSVISRGMYSALNIVIVSGFATDSVQEAAAMDIFSCRGQHAPCQMSSVNQVENLLLQSTPVFFWRAGFAVSVKAANCNRFRQWITKNNGNFGACFCFFKTTLAGKVQPSAHLQTKSSTRA